MHYNDQILIESYKVSLRAKIYIDAHYHDSELSIGFLSDRLFTTDQTLRANFKQDFGKTPKAYLIEVHMQKAHLLLKTKDLPIHKVCRLVGYDDAKNFGLQFKKFFGYPPSKTKRV